MLDLTLKLALLVSAVCLVPVALIRAQPYDDSELRAFLTPPEGCPAPCFLGIRPGVTTVEEAILILGSHEWVNEFERMDWGAHWSWSQKSPGFLDKNSFGYLFFIGNIVHYLTVDTNITQYQIWRIFGLPRQGSVTLQPGSMTHYTNYDREKFRVRTWTPCPASYETFFNSSVQIEVGIQNPISLAELISGGTYRKQLMNNLRC